MSAESTMWNAAAAAHMAAREWDSAAKCWLRQLRVSPDDPVSRIGLSQAWTRLGRYRDAHDLALQTMQAPPNDPALRIELALGLRYFGEVDAMVSVLTGVKEQLTAPQCAQAAELLSSVDVHAAAAELAAASIDKNPEFAPGFYLRGRSHLFHGRLSAAEQDFESCVAIAPDAAAAHWSLAGLRTATPERNDVDRLAEALQRVEPGSESAAQFAYALHSQLHDLGRFDQAWDALQFGCRIMRARLHFDAAACRATFAAIQSLCTEQYVSESPGAPAEVATPVFIVGLFRSGTTLVEQMLARHSQVSAGGESQAFFASLAQAANRRCAVGLDIDQLTRLEGANFALIGTSFRRLSRRSARGKGLWTEKLPANSLAVGMIAKALPEARFVLLKRDLRDCAFSNLRTLYSNTNAYSYNQLELASYFLGHQQLMTHWQRLIPNRLLEVSLDRLVADPQGQAHRLAAFCGLDYEPVMIEPSSNAGAIATASSVKIRRGIRATDEPDWLPYQDRLRPMFELLDATV